MSNANRLRPHHLSPFEEAPGDGHQGGGGVAAEDGGENIGEDGDEVIEMDAGERAGEAPAAQPRMARSPREPSAQARLLHEITHIPHRTWCRHCMRGRCKDVYHARLSAEQDIPRIGMDYMHVSEHGVTHKKDEVPDGDAVEVLTMLVVKDAWHKSIWIYPVEGKGVMAAEWLPEMLRKDLATSGLDNCMLVVKSDQEPAIRELQEEIARQRRSEGAVGTIIENSKVGDSSTNGRTERAIQEVGGMLRTLKFALEERTGGETIGLAHPIMPWAAKHASMQINRFQVRANGLTAYQSMKGYACRDAMVEFGECVLFRPPKTYQEKKHKDVLAERVVDGVWLGSDIRTGADIVATPSGVFHSGKVVRKSPGERWSRQAIDAVVGCPQEPVPGRGGRDIPSFVRPELKGDEKIRPPRDTVPADMDDYRVLPMFVRKADVHAFGRTPGCPGCRDVLLDRARQQPHNRECRERMERMLSETDTGKKRVQAASDRIIEATMRRSDAIFAETEEKKRKTDGGDQDRAPAAESAARPSSSSAPSSSAAVPSRLSAALSRKRRPEVDTEDLDPRAGGDAHIPEVVIETSGTKRRADRAVADIDPSAGDGTDVSLVDASPQRGTMPGGVPGDQGNRAIASLGDGDPLAGLPGVAGGPTSVRRQRHGPAQRIFGDTIPHEELQWKQIGSGMWARSFVGMTKLLTTTRSGPQESEVQRRIVRNVDTGKILDDCVPDDTVDEKLYRTIEKTNIRVELVMKDAAKWFRIQGPDISEIYSPPRIAQEAGLRTYGGKVLKPGWSLDLTTNDPETGCPWDLSSGKVRNKVVALIRDSRP